MPAAQPEPDFAADALARLDDERRVKGVLGDVAALPRAEFEVLVLCGWLDVGYEDAALALGIPIGTVRSRLSRARRRMRELQAGPGHEESVKATRKQAFER